MQIFNLFLPRVNVRRTSAWYKESEMPDFSPSDSQVPALPSALICHLPCAAALLMSSRCVSSYE